MHASESDLHSCEASLSSRKDSTETVMEVHILNAINNVLAHISSFDPSFRLRKQ